MTDFIAKTAIGMISGTSMDAIDIALVRTDGVNHVEPLGGAAYPYPAELRAELRAVLHDPSIAEREPLPEIEARVTDAFAEAVERFLRESGIDRGAVDLVGNHGQTIWHNPARRFTRQLGDGRQLADRLGIAVVDRFRHADVAAGGQGAPLVPLYHAALAHALDGPLVVLNLGGVANITYLDGGAFSSEVGTTGRLQSIRTSSRDPEGRASEQNASKEKAGAVHRSTWIESRSKTIIACDTGPASALIDDAMHRHFGLAFDEDGAVARRGNVDAERLAHLLDMPFFDEKPPKSLDRNAFHQRATCVSDLSPDDQIATLSAFTIAATTRVIEHLPKRPRRWLVTGGGRHNRFFMEGFARALQVPVEAVEAVGWNGDLLEAECFAYLAVRAQNGLPLSLPTTTGVPEPMPGGTFWAVSSRLR